MEHLRASPKISNCWEINYLLKIRTLHNLKPEEIFQSPAWIFVCVASFKCWEPRSVGDRGARPSSSMQMKCHVKEGDQNPRWRGPTPILLLFLLFNTAEKFPVWEEFPNSATQIIHFISSRKRTRFQFHRSGKKQEALLTDIYLPSWVPRGSFLSQEEPGCEGWRLALNLNFSTDSHVTPGKALSIFEPWFPHLKNENFLSLNFFQCPDDDVLVGSAEMAPLPGFYFPFFLCSKYFIPLQGPRGRHKVHNNLNGGV